MLPSGFKTLGVGIWVLMGILLAASVVTLVRTGSATSFEAQISYHAEIPYPHSRYGRVCALPKSHCASRPSVSGGSHRVRIAYIEKWELDPRGSTG